MTRHVSRRRFVQSTLAAGALSAAAAPRAHVKVGLYGITYLAMELVGGRPLKGPLPVKQAIEYGIQIADALAVAHAAGIVHRDLKPGNILVTEKGSVKVLDFGLAKLAEQESAPVSTQTVGLAGTPGYMAPEQIDGQPADTRSDIFAFGCVLYELLSGHRAFPGETISAALNATVTTEPKALEGVPERLDELVRRCLRKDPARRFQHMDDVKVELEELKQAGGGADGLSRQGQAGLGRPVAGHASGHGRLVRQAEERARADQAGDGFSPAQQRQRDGRRISGSGRAARGGIGKPGAGARRGPCGSEAGPEPRRTGHGGAGSGAGRRYGRGGEAGGRTRQELPAR
jgi:hypothetical protein